MGHKFPVFLSYPTPHMRRQEEFIDRVKKILDARGLVGRTLGVTDYDMDEPLTAIRRIILECNGVITIAFRRTLIEKGTMRAQADNGKQPSAVDGMWLTSPFCHIEAAMAFQVGVPVLVFREQGVIADGVLEKGIMGSYLPEFSLDGNIDQYFEDGEWNQILGKWEGYVRRVVENRGKPPKLY